MKSSFLVAAAALLAPALASAQQSFIVSLAPEVSDITSISIFVKVSDGGSTSSAIAPRMLSVAAGKRLDFNVSYVDLSNSAQYSLLGIYGASGVVISVDDRVAGALVGRTWDSIFPGFAEASVNRTLATFVNADPLDDDFLGAFVFANYLRTVRVTIDGAQSELFAPLGSQSTLLNFSQASFNGFANMQAVPEPGTWALYAAGLGAVGAVVRRRKTSH